MQTATCWLKQHIAIERLAMSIVDRLVSSGASVSHFAFRVTKKNNLYLQPVISNSPSQSINIGGEVGVVSSEILGISISLVVARKLATNNLFSFCFLSLYSEASIHKDKNKIFKIIFMEGAIL